MAAPIPESMPREEALAEIVRRLHFRWRLVIFLPLAYLLIALWVWRQWLLPERGGEGLFPMSDGTYVLLMAIGGMFVFVLWRFLERLRLVQLVMLSEVRKDVNDFYQRAKSQQMLQYAICDLITLPGLLFFFLQGDMFALVAFIVLGMLTYLRSIPSERRLGQAMFRPAAGA